MGKELNERLKNVLFNELAKVDNDYSPEEIIEFKKLESPSIDLKEEEERDKELWNDIYNNIIILLKKFCDLKEEYYNLIALWIIGTHFHKRFETYPYLFLNAMRGSGKTRLLKLIKLLSKEGQMLNSLTEAVLFRTTGTLCIDEFEGVNRQGNENLRELLNSAYKKGTSVKRMKQKKTENGTEQVVEEFEVYRPICLANITGMESVLGDRCLTLIIEKSSKSEVTRLIENFEQNYNFTQVLKLLRKSEVSEVKFSYQNMYVEWNNYVSYIHNTSHTSISNKFTNIHLYKKIYDTNIDGRHLELSLPLFVIAGFLGEEVLDETIETIKMIVKEKKEEDINSNMDVAVIDFISQYTSNEFRSVKQLTNDFKQFKDTDEAWINTRWFGRALKRLNLIIEKKHMNSGNFVRVDITKAQEKIRMFK